MFAQGVIDKFWSQVDKNGPTPEHRPELGSCWSWTGGKIRDGYGEYRIKKKAYGTHRLSWMLHYGIIPDGLLVCHSCDNPACVNPAHLWLGTVGDNARDRQAKGRGSLRSGEENPSAKLTDEQVAEIRQLYATGEYSQRALALRFGVSQAAIYQIVHFMIRR